MVRVSTAEDVRRALAARPCATCGATRFVREAELASYEGGYALRFQTCASCGRGRDVYLQLQEDFEHRLAFVRPYDPRTIASLAPLVTKGFPAYGSAKEQSHATTRSARIDPRGVSAGEGWQLVAWLRGSTAYGQLMIAHQ